MARKIPIGEATELDVETPDMERAARGLREPTMTPEPLGKRGPQYTRDSFQGPTRPASAKPVAEALAKEARGLTGLAEDAGKAVRAAAPTLRAVGKVAGGAGVLENFNDYKLNDPNVDSSAAGTIRALSQGDFAGAGRSAGKGLIETGMDLGSFAANTADYLLPGQPASQAYNRLLRDTFGSELTDNSGNAESAGGGRGFVNPPSVGIGTPSAQTPTAPPVSAGGGRGFVNPPLVGEPQPARGLGGIRRQGNLYTDGSVAVPGEKTGFGGPEVAAIEARARAIEAENSALRRSLDPNFLAQGGPAISLSSGFGDRLQKLNDETTVASLRNDARLAGLGSGRGSRARAAALDAAATEAERTQASTRTAATQNSQGLRIAELNNATSRRGQDIVAESTRRGQDFTASTARAANQLAAQNAQRQQDNLDRSYKLDVAKFGTEVAEKNRTAGAAAQKAQQERMENTFRTTDEKGNSVPDHAKIASFNASVDTTLPQLIGALQKTGTAAALAKAREIQERGAAALGPEDQAELVKLFQTREQLRGARSMLPGGAEFSDSDNLLNFRQAAGDAGVDRRFLTPNRVAFQGGSSATPNDLTIRGGANAFIPDFGKERNDNLIRGLRLPE